MTDLSRKFTANDSALCFAFATAVYLLLSVVSGAVLSVTEQGSLVYWLIIAANNALLGVSAWVFAKIRKKDFVSAMHANAAPKIPFVLWGVGVVVGLVFFMTPIVNWLCDLIEAVGLSRPTVSLPKQFVPLLLTATFLPALSEEFLFRGVIGNGFANDFASKTKAALLTGALFSLFHANPAQTLHQFILGSFLAVTVFQSGSVWTAVILHFVNNLVSVVGEFVLPQWLPTHPITCVCGAVVVVVMLFGYFNCAKKYAQQDKVSQKDGEQVAKVIDSSMLYALIASVCVFVLLWCAVLFG